jgi:hypothetical protein
MESGWLDLPGNVPVLLLNRHEADGECRQPRADYAEDLRRRHVNLKKSRLFELRNIVNRRSGPQDGVRRNLHSLRGRRAQRVLVQQQQAVPRGCFAHLLRGVQGARLLQSRDAHSYFGPPHEQHLALQVSLRRPRLAALFLRQDLIKNF